MVPLIASGCRFLIGKNDGGRMPKHFDAKMDVDVAEAMGQIRVRLKIHKKRRTLFRGYIATFLVSMAQWVAPWEIIFVEDEK